MSFKTTYIPSTISDVRTFSYPVRYYPIVLNPMFSSLLYKVPNNLIKSLFIGYFGHVLASSGIQKDPKYGNIQDWALIRLDNSRFPNSPPNTVGKQDW